jgi:hypothetical protein
MLNITVAELMARIGDSIYMRHPAPVKDYSQGHIIYQSILTSTGFANQNPPMGLLTKTRTRPCVVLMSE